MGLGFGSLEIARTGMYVNERGLNVTGHNLANVNTPSYVRQQATICDSRYMNIGGGFQVGLGASVEQIRQIRYQYLDDMYRKENATLGYWEARNRTFEEIEAIIGEPMEDGLQSVLNKFWDSWQELSKDPSSLTVRALVKQRAEALIYKMNHLDSQLSKLQDDLNTKIFECIDEINSIGEQLVELNQIIAKYEVNGEQANDYRDQRNNLLDRLSYLVNIDVREMQDGQVSVTINGYYLVYGSRHTKLYAEEKTKGSGLYVPKFEGVDKELKIGDGALKGLMESRGDALGILPDKTDTSINLEGNIISELRQQLNTLAKFIFNEVNKLHKSGKTMNPEPNNQGEDFFVLANPNRPLGMGNIKLNDNLSDLNNIVASQTGDYGDNTIALKIANIRNEATINVDAGVVSMDDYYQAIIQEIGNVAGYTKSIYEGQEKLVQSADNFRQSVSGVSMDEEMTNLMRYKFAYNASARTINVIDEMIKTIIERTGLAGR